jgi:hypothetical protein
LAGHVQEALGQRRIIPAEAIFELCDKSGRPVRCCIQAVKPPRTADPKTGELF